MDISKLDTKTLIDLLLRIASFTITQNSFVQVPKDCSEVMMKVIEDRESKMHELCLIIRAEMDTRDLKEHLVTLDNGLQHLVVEK